MTEQSGGRSLQLPAGLSGGWGGGGAAGLSDGERVAAVDHGAAVASGHGALGLEGLGSVR